MRARWTNLGLSFLWVALCWSSPPLGAAQSRPAKPNVLLLLTDDLGWQDVKCYDVDEASPYETPNIDALAEKGVLFWQAYAPAPTCSPSRCAILSGNHPARAQKTHVLGGVPPHPRNRHSRMMDPWYSGRMPADEFTLAKALKQVGYTTGHVGKWHIAINHHAFPQPEDVGFDFTRSNRGTRTRMKDRLTGFATEDPSDPYRLDANGYPFHQNNEDALEFIRKNQDKPFFLYYATWLVHSPIHTRAKDLLDKYVRKIGTDPRHTPKKDTPGQLNPFYAAMVQELDYYVGIVFDYLDQTEDPRWPGHKLSENTYVIFTSDNGGMEGGPDERYTDNHPLNRGKISAMEGGTRVPLIITGPGIPAGVQTDVMANGLDFYPTVLSMVGMAKPEAKRLDGCDLFPLLTQDPTDPSRVRETDGSVRNTLVWHFPHGVALESTIRIGDYKLIYNYDHVNHPSDERLELYRLYDSTGAESLRVDIEESKNLAQSMPNRTQQMFKELTGRLEEMKASTPSYNPDCRGALPGKERVPTVVSTSREGDRVEFVFRENGAKVVRADLIYTPNGGARYEEWFRVPGKLVSSTNGSAQLAKEATHYYLNLIDENNFLVSYPEPEQITVRGTSAKTYSMTAIRVEE